MTKAYIKHDDGVTTPMDVIRCKDENKELQQLLEKNPDLLPGEQINPEDPCRWLTIAREMLVPDPKTGTNRWSIDFLFADQAAIPTFVECKRFEDTRSRREVIGQMFEYAANGHYYWAKEMLKERAEDFAARHGTSLDKEFERLATEKFDVESYFEALESNLRQSQVRLVLFLEEAPSELKSVVDFLNKQLERTDLLLVEARQFRHDGLTVVVPSLFGYTEEARQVKRIVTVTSGPKKLWDYDSFFAEADSQLDPQHVTVLRKLYSACEKLGCEINWGEGRLNGSFKVSHPSLGPMTILVVYTNGRFEVYFRKLSGTEKLDNFRDSLKGELVSKMGLTVPDDYTMRFPLWKKEEWIDKADQLIATLRALVPK